MYYCQDCGTPVPGNYCPNCGTPVGTYTPAAPRYRIYQDVEVKPRYSTGALILAGYLGFTFLLAAIFVVIGAIYMFTLPDITAGEKLIFPICALFTFFIAFLLYLPGIHSIRKYSPEGMAMDAFKSFFWKSVGFIFLWGVSIAGCVYIIGIPFRVWRLGLWASRPNDDHYTALVNGRKIPITRYYDDLPDGGPRGKWVYMDENGTFYRPPVR